MPQQSAQAASLQQQEPLRQPQQKTPAQHRLRPLPLRLTARESAVTKSSSAQKTAWQRPPTTRRGQDYFDDYRRDCSGFVSYAWNSGGPGEASFTFVPNGVAHTIAWEDIQPGDAITGPDHIVLVKAVNPDGSFELLEHGGGQTGKEAPNTRHATKDELISQNVGEPIRYNGVA